MSDTDNLSQEEIDELSRALEASAADAVPARNTEVRDYDFLHPDKLSKSNLRVLRYMFSGLERSWSATISSAVKAEAIVTLNSLEQASMRNYIDSCSLPSATAMIRMPALSTTGLLDMPAAMAMGIIDRLSGGRGRWDGPAKQLSQIERRILRRLLDRMVEDFVRVWRPITEFEADVLCFHNSPEESGIDESTMVLVAGFGVAVGQKEARINVAIPAGSLDCLRDLLTPENWCRGTSEASTVPGLPVSDLLGPITVESQVELGRAMVSMQDLVGLAVGDVVLLDRAVGEELEIKIGGSMKFLGLPGLVGNKLAVRITDTMQEAAAPAAEHMEETISNGKEVLYNE